jgi:ADP-heptose:LPS heptosyltransferase
MTVMVSKYLRKVFVSGLFITSSRIGDAVMTLSILTAFRKKNPNMTYVVAADPFVSSLFLDDPACKKIIHFKKKSLSMHWVCLIRQCILNYWDWIIDTRGSGVSFFIPHKWHAIWRSFKKDNRPKIEQLCAMIKEPATVPEIIISEERRTFMKSLLPKGPLLIVAPVASWIGKQWPFENFMKIMKNFLDTVESGHVLVLAAPLEEFHLAPLRKTDCDLPMDRVTISTDLVKKYGFNLMDIAALMSPIEGQNALFLGNDSGLMHIAYALGLPVIALFGPTREWIYGPFPKDKHMVIRTRESFDEIVNDANYSPVSKNSYLTSIDVNFVWNAIKNKINI